MFSITAVLGFHEVGLGIRLRVQEGCQISTGREDFAGSSAALSMLSEGWKMKLSEFKDQHAMRKGDYLWQGVVIVVGGVQTFLDVRCMCSCMTHGRILLQGSVSRNLFSTMRPQVDHLKVEVRI
jgi:hypothetical protein